MDIARFYDLGFNEMADLYPEMDPWLPRPGSTLVIPSLWILPKIKKPGIVINVAEMRLYYFLNHSRKVRTFPVAVGQCLWPSPTGNFRVIEKLELTIIKSMLYIGLRPLEQPVILMR
ncbi:L,D-transpeptidase family protein [Desulfobacter curvatus]|uniref:L,D-transpeptidase family protein n=1 Tax=Desulfobacter curvatus TaxID=2290 RepID=UPI00036C7EAF|nr:L,D-transpeptidase family protein [Desulfobacter curvatus]